MRQIHHVSLMKFKSPRNSLELSPGTIPISVGIDYEKIHCIRVTPHVYTTIADLDRFVGAIGESVLGGLA